MPYFAYWRPSKCAKKDIAISNVIFCIFESTWVTNDDKVAIKSQNLKFHFWVEKWLSLGHLLRKKNRKSWKHVFYTNWTILSRKKFFFDFFRKKIFFGSFSKFHKIRHISWTAPQNLLIFSGMIALDSAFQNIIPVFPGKIKILTSGSKSTEKTRFRHVFVIFEWSGFFPGNPAVSGTPTHHPLSSCQIFWKSQGGKYHNFLW